jgi:hypothetical protein
MSEHLSDVVRFDLPRLGDVRNLRGVRLAIEHPYFEHEEPFVYDDDKTYVETPAVLQHITTHSWNHGLGEIVTALLEVGMELTMLTEHDSVPWDALPGQMERIDNKEWRLADRPRRLPHSYTLRAVKRAT